MKALCIWKWLILFQIKARLALNMLFFHQLMHISALKTTSCRLHLWVFAAKRSHTLASTVHLRKIKNSEVLPFLLAFFLDQSSYNCIELYTMCLMNCVCHIHPQICMCMGVCVCAFVYVHVDLATWFVCIDRLLGSVCLCMCLCHFFQHKP